MEQNLPEPAVDEDIEGFLKSLEDSNEKEEYIQKCVDALEWHDEMINYWAKENSKKFRFFQEILKEAFELDMETQYLPCDNYKFSSFLEMDRPPFSPWRPLNKQKLKVKN